MGVQSSWIPKTAWDIESKPIFLQEWWWWRGRKRWHGEKKGIGVYPVVELIHVTKNKGKEKIDKGTENFG